MININLKKNSIIEKKNLDQFDEFFIGLVNKEMGEDQQIMISSFGGGAIPGGEESNGAIACEVNIKDCHSEGNDRCNTVAGCACKS